MEKRNQRIIYNKDGHGTLTTKISLPIKWTREMGFSENDRNALIDFDGKKITIKKGEKNEN